VRILIDGARILEPASGTTRAGWVLLSDDRIESMSEDPKPTDVAADVTIDAGGRTLLPGLIDCHTHVIGLSPEDPDPDADSARVARDTVSAVVGLSEVVRSGVTTLRDCGHPHHGIFAVRAASDEGRIDAPRMCVSGRAITATGGHGSFLAVQVDGVDAVRRAVRLEAKAGAEWIKVMVTGGTATPGEEVTDVQLTLEEVRAVVDEAHRRGRGVCAHVSNLAGTHFALEAGVDSIEHGIALDDVAVERMVETGTWLVPSLLCTKTEGEAGPESGIPEFIRRKGAEIYRQQMTSFQRAIAAGVRIAAGTDAAVPYLPLGGPTLAAELALMVELGMRPAAAIASATSDAARMLGIDGLGVIEPDAKADLVVVDGDPLSDLTTLGRPWLVVSRGRALDGRWNGRAGSMRF
jgi:imidazolonepropionase-like amidohydrolase